ncbi:MAG TPA: DUF6265 family protein [Terricaulis sp.]|nr:DUF6265 family protein [Terricaulis sp.]
MKALLRAMACAVALVGSAYAQSIDDAAWLAGRWVGEGFGGEMEEAWAPPVGGQMVGHFRYWRDGAPQFYEILLMDVVEGGVRMRVKHFNPDFTAWEEPGEWVEFAPVSAGPDALIFDGLEIRREGEDRITMRLRMRRGGEVTHEILSFSRAPL